MNDNEQPAEKMSSRELWEGLVSDDPEVKARAFAYLERLDRMTAAMLAGRASGKSDMEFTRIKFIMEEL